MLRAEDYVRLIDDAMPEGYLRDTASLVVRAYRASAEWARETFDREVAHDLLPHVRRAWIEQGWLSLANRYPGVVAIASPNRVGSSFHTLIRCGSVVLTASKVDTPDALPRDAVFRQSYAQGPQLYLDLPGVPPPPDVALARDADALYALLIHGPDERIVGRPAFIRLGVPTPTCSSYVAQVDLLKRFPAVLSLEQGAPIAEPVTPVEPVLRTRIDRKKQEA